MRELRFNRRFLPRAAFQNCESVSSKKCTAFDKPCQAGEQIGAQNKLMTTATLEIKGESIHSPSHRLHLKKILVPLDFSPPSQQALRYGIRLATEFRAELIVIHIIRGIASRFPDAPDLPAVSPEEQQDAEEQLSNIVSSAAIEGVNSRYAFRTGLASHQIVEAAKELNVDLIVIATHGYTGWKHFCIGSTAESVVRTAPCPVFVVREKEREFI